MALASPADRWPDTPRSIIARSISMHPSMLIECLDRARLTHLEAARSMLDKPAVRIAVSMADSCLMAAKFVEADNIDAIMTDMAGWQAALLCACRLQCLPHGTAQEACEASDRLDIALPPVRLAA
jgi:hypothetical protein